MDYEPISLSSALDGVWAIWFVEEPWPEFALIQPYDVGVGVYREGTRERIYIECKNGSAEFEVVSRDRYGAYQCRLLPGSTFFARAA